MCFIKARQPVIAASQVHAFQGAYGGPPKPQRVLDCRIQICGIHHPGLHQIGCFAKHRILQPVAHEAADLSLQQDGFAPIGPVQVQRS